MPTSSNSTVGATSTQLEPEVLTQLREMTGGMATDADRHPALQSRLLIDETPLQVLPSLAFILGLNEAIFVQQLHYWLKRSSHEFAGVKWVYNTYEDWQEQFPFWSVVTVRRLIRSLEERNIVISTTRLNWMKVDRTKWYTLRYDKLNNLISTIDQNDHM